MKKWLFIPAIAFALNSPMLFAQYTIYGEGVMSCGQWLDFRKEDGRQSGYAQAWVLGFVSGYGYTSANTLKATDNSAMNHWIDGYCEENPLDTLAKAVAQLTSALKE